MTKSDRTKAMDQAEIDGRRRSATTDLSTRCWKLKASLGDHAGMAATRFAAAAQFPGDVHSKSLVSLQNKWPCWTEAMDISDRGCICTDAMIQFPSDALRSLAGAEDDPERGAFEFEVLGYAMPGRWRAKA